MLNIRGQALNVLNFGALSITASARFARKSAFHIRSFQNNRIAIYSYALMVILQVLILYIPGVNNIIFSQTGLKGWQWGVTLLMTFGVFVVMEVEKCIRNYLTFLKYDTDDRESDDVFDLAPEPDAAIPEEVGRFGKNELLRH
jgi:magnesium-transporting ATPase (P-type)